jgi:hypothetical protein
VRSEEPSEERGRKGGAREKVRADPLPGAIVGYSVTLTYSEAATAPSSIRSRVTPILGMDQLVDLGKGD